MTKESVHALFVDRERAWASGHHWTADDRQLAALMDTARDGFAAQDELAHVRAELTMARAQLAALRAAVTRPAVGEQAD